MENFRLSLNIPEVMIPSIHDLMDVSNEVIEEVYNGIKKPIDLHNAAVFHIEVYRTNRQILDPFDVFWYQQ